MAAQHGLALSSVDIPQPDFAALTEFHDNMAATRTAHKSQQPSICPVQPALSGVIGSIFSGITEVVGIIVSPSCGLDKLAVTTQTRMEALCQLHSLQPRCL